MKSNFLIQDILKYGYSWLIICLPAIIAFLIVGPLNDIPQCIVYGHEFGFILTSLCLSVSAVGIFHFFIVYRPNRIKSRMTNKLVEQHFYFLDKVLLELIKIVDPSIKNLEQLEKNIFPFGERVKNFDFTKKVPWVSKTIGIRMGNYNKLFSSALARFENIKDAMVFNPNEFDISDFEKINDSIFHRDIFAKEDLDKETYQRCFLTILEFYIKLRENVKKQINKMKAN